MTYRRIRLAQIGNSRVVDFSVQELVRYLKKMDPQLIVEVLQTDTVRDDFKQVIWIGLDDKLNSQVPEVKERGMDDAIAVKVENGSGYITGSNERSVLLASYRFLKALGCDWVRPGVEGERIPCKHIENINVSIWEAASYRHRGICIEGANTYENVLDMIDYLPKIGMNAYFMQFMVPSVFFDRWYKHKRNPYVEEENMSRDEIEAMVFSLENEISRRGICYHKTGHGWTCEPFGIEGTSWEAMTDYELSEQTRMCLAEVNGKRDLWYGIPLNTNLCYSNPEVRNTVTDAITEYCKENQHVDVLHFWLADAANNHCECDGCVKMRPADWYIVLLNELDEKMSRAGINTKVVFLIYMDLLWEPIEKRLNNPERFILMFAPITRNYGQNYGDYISYDEELPPYVRNQLSAPSSLAQNLEQLRRWQGTFEGDSFDFDYHLMWAHLGDIGYEYCARNIFQDMRDLRDIGLNGMISCQIQRCYFPTALPLHMMAAALWNRDCDYEDKVLAYYKSAYGEDGEQVHRYLEKISDLLLLYEGPSHGDPNKSNGPFCKDYSLLEKEITIFAEMIQKNIMTENMWQEEWMNLELHRKYLCLLLDALKLREQGKNEETQAKIDMVADLINRNEMSVQKVLDGDNTIGYWNKRLKTELSSE